MTTRIIRRNRVIWANDRPEKPLAFNDAAKDEPKAVQAIRSGLIWFDPEDLVYYRVVSAGRLLASEGWGDVTFWTQRFLHTRWELFRTLIQKGYFDAAMEEGVFARRYRALDIDKARAYLDILSPRGALWQKRNAGADV
jgi:hypothetical protein